jgi:nitrite reductase (NADH) small subunit
MIIDAASTTEIPVGRMKAVVAGERRIVLCHTKSGFFALDNTCPHRGGPLVEGDLLGDEVICPWHLWGFDVATGICTGNREVAVASHAVRIEGDRILVNLS